VEEYCQQKRVRFAQQLEIGSSEAQCEGVLAGLGLALLPRHAVQRELASGLLCQLPVQELPLQRSWCLVSQRGRQLSPVARAFADFIQQRRMCWRRWSNASTPSRLLKNYLRCHCCVKNRLKMLIYSS